MNKEILTFNQVIEEICNDKNIKYKLLSKDWIIMLEKDNKTRFISGYKFGLNDHALGEIIDDKYALYDVLKSKNIPVIEYNILFSEKNRFLYAQDCNNRQLVKDFFLSHNKNIVIKSNIGTGGNDVYLLRDINEIDNILDKLFEKNHSISYCPFYKIKNEYRVILLNSQVKLVYRKIRPIVYGDGKKTIKELLIDFNEHYFFGKLNDNTYERVLKKGEEYQYDWKFNLSRGAIAKKLNDKELEDKLSTLATIATKLLNINFCSVDIIETDDNELRILEINSGVMMANAMNIFTDGKKIAKEIYSEAINEMFK